MDKTTTVVIATFNRAKSLGRCLLSLTKQSDKKFNVLIIDGGSTDQTQKIIKQYRRKLNIDFLIDETPHLSYIRDLAWRKAKGAIIASIDDDVIVSPNWIHAIKKALNNKNVGGVTGPTVIPKKLLQNRDVFLFHTTNNPFLKFLGEIYFKLFMQGEKYAIGKIYPSGAWSPGSNFPSALKLKKPIEVDYLEACNYAIRKSMIEKIGGYNLNYRETSEWCEIDLFFRIRKAGYQLVFDSSIVVWHWVSISGVYIKRINYFHRLRNFVRYYFSSYYPKTMLGFFQFYLYLHFLIIYCLYLKLTHLKKRLNFINSMKCFPLKYVKPYGWTHLLTSYKIYVKETSTVLEIGASNIQYTRDLSLYCHKLIGLELLSRLTPKNFKNVEYINDDWKYLSEFIKPESIDIVVASHVIEHMKDDLQAINELYTVLKPGGVALLTTPNRERLTRTIIELFTVERRFPWKEHEREYVESDLLKLIEASKFKKFKIVPVVFGLHAGPVYIYLKSVPKLFKKYTNFWEIHLFK